MKDLKKIFSRRYSAVSTKDELSGPELNLHQRRKSLKPTRSLNPGFNILDTFFNKRNTEKQTRSPKFAFILLAGGLLAIITGILVKVFQPYDLIFKWKLILSEDGEIFSFWEKPPVDLYIKIYLFNITNAEEYMAGTEKMNIEEIGPYVYKELMTHDDVIFNDNNTLSSRPRHPLEWQEHLSGGRRENDTVVMLNIALLSIAQFAAEKSYFFRVPINILIRQTKSEPIVKMTAREFMFGYKSSITTLGNTFLSDWIYFDKVGLIDRMYDYDKDYETFYTGEDEVRKSGLYATYMGSKNLPQWNHDHCSNIDMSSDGAKFKSFIKPNETLKFFRKSMCRPMYLKPEGGITKVSKFTAIKYVNEDNAMDNGLIDARNKCYCRRGYCQPKGLLDVTDCYYGFPISLSYPHFLDSDPKLLDYVEGLNPDPVKHKSFFIIQPDSGLPLQISAKMQINMHFRNLQTMAHVEKFSYTTIPMLWLEISLNELPEPLVNRFYLYLNILPSIDIIGFWVPLLGGIFCLLIGIIRATLKIPQFILPSSSPDKQKSNKKTEKSSLKSGGKRFSKGNLRSGVYNACEVKLFELNEKSKDGLEEKLIGNDETTKKQFQIVNLNNDGSSDDDVMVCEMDQKASGFSGKRRESKFVLENEPALSDNESDSDDSGSSHLSTIETDNGSSDSEKRKSEIIDEENKIMKNESLQGTDNLNFLKNENAASGFGIERNPKSSDNTSWMLGQTSSLIDDIGNDKFFDEIKIAEFEVQSDPQESSSSNPRQHSSGAIKKERRNIV